MTMKLSDKQISRFIESDSNKELVTNHQLQQKKALRLVLQSHLRISTDMLIKLNIEYFDSKFLSKLLGLLHSYTVHALHMD